MNTRQPSRLQQAMRRLGMPLALTAVALLASCGGGDDATTRYRAVGMSGDAIDYRVDVAGLSYDYSITDSASGLAGRTGSGSLLANTDGTFTPSGVDNARVAVLANGIVLGAVRERFGDTEATMPLLGFRDSTKSTAALAGLYNYVHRGCSAAATCDASYGTLRIAADGTWSACREGNLAVSACASAADGGTLESLGKGEFRVKSVDGSHIGTATGLDGTGQKLFVLKLKDGRAAGFGNGMLIGGEQAPMTAEIADGTYIAGMNNGTWFQFSGKGTEINITHLDFQPVDLKLTIAPNAPWTGMTTTAWGEIGFISAAGLYLLKTPGGDLELGVKLR